MTDKNRSAERFIESLAAAEVPRMQAQPAQKSDGVSNFIGSVGGDVIIFGEVPDNALEMILARSANRRGRSD